MKDRIDSYCLNLCFHQQQLCTGTSDDQRPPHAQFDASVVDPQVCTMLEPLFILISLSTAFFAGTKSIQGLHEASKTSSEITIGAFDLPLSLASCCALSLHTYIPNPTAWAFWLCVSLFLFSEGWEADEYCNIAKFNYFANRRIPIITKNCVTACSFCSPEGSVFIKDPYCVLSDIGHLHVVLESGRHFSRPLQE